MRVPRDGRVVAVDGAIGRSVGVCRWRTKKKKKKRGKRDIERARVGVSFFRDIPKSSKHRGVPQ